MMFHESPGHTGKLIVIDDEPSVGKLIARLLERKGHSVDIATSGEQGVDMIKKGGYDLVITDVKLPGMDGMAVLEKIKEIDTDIDVIVITGFGSIESAVSFMKAGALDYISKPINSDYLEIVIQKAVERKYLIRAARERDTYFKLSLTDALTGLFNHKYFQEQLDREILFHRRKNQNLSVMILDIDDFKLVNDSHGHQTGDRVLQLISSNIMTVCRTHDTVARYGGEEFGIILPDTNIDRSETVAHRILDITSSQVYPPLTSPITVSIGISSFPRDGHERPELIKKADMALYESKRKGKNCYTVFYEKTDCRDTVS